MKFGASTWLWASPFTTDSVVLFRKIKAFGFDYVEIPVEDPTLIEGAVVRRALDDEGLTTVVCGAFGPERDLTHDDPTVRAGCLDYIERCLDLCSELGSPVFTGPMYAAVGKARLVAPEQRHLEWCRAVENLRGVAERAHARGLRLAIEPLNRFESDLVNTARDAVRLVDQIGHQAAGILLDSFHMTIEERDLEQAVCTAGARLFHMQVSENYRGTPGTGLTNWPALKRGLAAVKYQGGISIESFTTDNRQLADAVCFWTPKAESQDALASEGLAFLRGMF